MGWSTDDLPDLTGRLVVVTGANAGLGLETSRQLVRHGATVVLACRSTERGEAARAELAAEPGGGDVELRELDLADLASVHRFADAFLADHDQLDVLVNNAGIMMVPRGTTVDGFERQIGTNHLGHFALTGLLLPALLATPGARVVTLSSLAHRGGKLDLDDLLYDRGGYTPAGAYARSKLANLVFALELQRRFAAVSADAISLAAHPGVSVTNLADHLVPSWAAGPFRLAARVLLQSAADGALPTLRAATDPELAGGEYLGPDGFREQRGAPVVVRPGRLARGEARAAGLWDLSVALTGVAYDELLPAP